MSLFQQITLCSIAWLIRLYLLILQFRVRNHAVWWSLSDFNFVSNKNTIIFMCSLTILYANKRAFRQWTLSTYICYFENTLTHRSGFQMLCKYRDFSIWCLLAVPGIFCNSWECVIVSRAFREYTTTHLYYFIKIIVFTVSVHVSYIFYMKWANKRMNAKLLRIFTIASCQRP